jgi:hypothetical protein
MTAIEDIGEPKIWEPTGARERAPAGSSDTKQRERLLRLDDSGTAERLNELIKAIKRGIANALKHQHQSDRNQARDDRVLDCRKTTLIRNKSIKELLHGFHVHLLDFQGYR